MPTQRGARPVRPLKQLVLELGPDRPRWTFSRLALRSRHLERIRTRIEFVRRFFPELDSCIVHVGLAMKRGVLGWGSLDPERPGVWVRPRRLEYFTIAHELTHLLQARGLVPRGERACDLWALARSSLLIDGLPSYLELPRALRSRPRPSLRVASLLHEAALQAIEARGRGARRYLSDFERDIARALERDGGLAGAGSSPGPGRRRTSSSNGRAAFGESA